MIYNKEELYDKKLITEHPFIKYKTGKMKRPYNKLMDEIESEFKDDIYYNLEQNYENVWEKNTNTRLVSIEVYKTQINIYLHTKVEDPDNLLEDVQNKGTWSKGKYKYIIKDEDDIEHAIFFITQAYKIATAPCDELEDTNVNTKVSRSQENPDYNKWRNSVLEKDGHKCVCCGLDKHLHVHHLFGYAENPELAIDENNGVTLCKFCHERYHSIYGKKNINPRDFVNYIKKYGN